MQLQQNDINLKVEDGDNFMSDYTTYTNYAKKAIDELQQLANFKKSLKTEIEKNLEDIRVRESLLQAKIGKDLTKHKIALRNNIISIRD